MTAYYRTSDGSLHHLTPEQFAALTPTKQTLLRLYSVDPMPTPSAAQYVNAGPIVVDATTARLTWVLVDKDTFTIKRETDYAQVRQVYLALKNGTGTVAERAARMEKVLCRLIIDALGVEPA